MKSSLLSNHKDTLPAKSRNPGATQFAATQKQAALLQTLPNNQSVASAVVGATDLGIGGNSAMTMMFNQHASVKRKAAQSQSKDVIQNSNQNNIISPSQAAGKRMQ